MPQKERERIFKSRGSKVIEQSRRMRMKQKPWDLAKERIICNFIQTHFIGVQKVENWIGEGQRWEKRNSR